MKRQGLFLVSFWVAACVATPRGEAPRGASGGGQTPSSIPAMTDAVLAIEDALGTERIRPLREGYERPFRIDPQDPFKRFLWAYSLDDRNDAWQELTKITKLNDRFYWAHLGMGIILDSWKVDDQAESAFARVLGLGPKIGLGYARYGRMQLRRGNHAKALEMLQRAVELEPRRLPFQLDLARALKAMGKTGEAVAVYRQVVAADEKNFVAFEELAGVLAAAGDKPAAIEAYAKAAALSAGAFEVRLEKARLLDELGRLEEALAAYGEACEARPDNLACWQSQAGVAQRADRPEARQAAFERVIGLDRANQEAHAFLAPIYLQRGEIEKAQPSFQVLLRKDRDNLEALWGLATIYESGEDFSRAIEYSERVLKVKPDHPEAQAAQKRLFTRFYILAERISGKTPDQVFGKNRSQIASVYKERLKTLPRMKGDLKIKVRVGDDGVVQEVAVSQDTVEDPVLELCAIWNLKRSIFPTGVGATYDFELTLRPGE